MTQHTVVIAGAGPTGLMLAGELALAGVDVGIVERRASQELAGSRSGGLQARTIEVLDQRGVADRFLSEGQVAQVQSFGGTVVEETATEQFAMIRDPDGQLIELLPDTWLSALPPRL